MTKPYRYFSILTLLFLAFCSRGAAQNIPYSNIVFSGSGRPIGGANVAACSTGLATTGAQVISNIGVFTMSSNPITAGFAPGMILQVQGFTGADTYLNAGTITNGVIVGGYVILAVSPSTVSVALTHASATAASNGTLFQQGNISTPCAPMAPISSDQAGLSPIAQPGLISDGIGNFAFYALPGLYNIQYYGSAITTTIRPAAVASGTTAVTTSLFAGLPPAPAVNALAIVLDGTGLNCFGGGGATRELCQWNGTTWILISGGGGGSLSGMTPTQVAVAATTNTVTSSVPASTTVNGQTCALGSTCTVTTGAATAPFISATSPSAASGTLRMANNEPGDCWRNASNTGDVCLTVDANNQVTGPNGILPIPNLQARGPNPAVDVTVFGVVAINHNVIPSPTATISSGTNSAVVSSATGLAKTNGFVIVGAGPVQSMTTPTAPTVTPSCASESTGMGYTVPVPGAATNYAYSLIMLDANYGYTAASTNGTTSTGNATLGARTTAITSIAAGATNTFTVTVGSTAELAAGCKTLIEGTTDDAEFGGYKIILAIVDATHFTYTTGVNFIYGMTSTTATGGTVHYWLCNHIVVPTPGAGGIQYGAFGRTSGSMAFLGLSLIANLGYADVSYNTFDDYGSPMMDSPPTPWWMPSSPPGSPVNDMLITYITNVSGTTLTLNDNASTSVTTAPGSFDNTAPFLLAQTAVTTNVTNAGGTLHFPPVPANLSTGADCYVFRSPLIVTARAVIQDGMVCPSATIKLSGTTWQGTPMDSPRLLSASNSLQAHIPILIQGANPAFWVAGGGVSGVIFLAGNTNGGVELFNSTSGGSQIFSDLTFNSNWTGDYMTVGFYDYHPSDTGAFGWTMDRISCVAGPNQVIGSTTTPCFASKFNTLMNVHYYSGNRRGVFIAPHSSGLSGSFHMGQEIQGLITPMFAFAGAYAGNVSGSFRILNPVQDTSAGCVICNFSPVGKTLGAMISIDGTNLPGSNSPLISGQPFGGTINIYNSSLTAATQLGQNNGVNVYGGNNGWNPGIRTPSLSLGATTYTTSHTLNAKEGIVVLNGTGTITVDTTLGDGQGWDVYCQSGTCTLAASAGTLHGNGATGSFVIPANTGQHVALKNGDAWAEGGGGGGGGGCTPGGTTDALLYNGGSGTCAGVNSPTVNGNYVVNYNVVAGAAVPPTITLPGVPINPQTGTTYTYLYSDRGGVVTASNAGAQTYTLVNPSASGFGSNYFNLLKNIGTGAVTEGASGFTVNGGASLLVPPSWTRFLWSDGVNYIAARFPDFGAFVNCVGGGNALQFTSATGVFSCGSSSAGVSSFSGDTVLLSNSLSTGVVTATLANAAAHKFLMNNTAGSAAPGYQSPGKADLLGTIVYNDQANTYSTGLQDLSAATIKPPAGAGFTAGATSQFGLDTTAKIFHFYTNNADSLNVATTATSTTVTQVLHATAVAGIYAPSAIATADLPAQYTKGSCTELWGGSGTSFALTSGDDAISNNSCYNDSGVTRTITAVKCRSDNGTNTTTVNPTFGAAGTGTTILSGALTCGSSLAYSSTGTVTNASWTTGTGITPAMSGTLTGTSIAMIVEYTY